MNTKSERAKLKARRRAKAWYYANKERAYAKSREAFNRNREERLAYHRAYYHRKKAENPEAMRKKGREYARKYRLTGKVRVYAQKYRALHPDQHKRYHQRSHQKSIKNLTRAYVSRYLRSYYKIKNPTPRQIEHRRTVLLAKRASLGFRLLSTAHILCKTSRR